jgi:citrate synthase
MSSKPLKTQIARSDAESITVRGHDLVNDLMGRRSFTEMLYFHVCQRFPSSEQARVLDACLVTVMEHGITPSSLIARIAADSAPGQMQIAVAAGLLAVGDVFVGTMEGCGEILARGVREVSVTAYCRGVVKSYLGRGQKLPGFGHPFHKPDDPRTPRLLQIAREQGLEGRYIGVLLELARALDEITGRHCTINATGGMAALLLEIGIPTDVFRGIAMVSRCAGLLGHIQEERREPTVRAMWKVIEDHTEYVGP